MKFFCKGHENLLGTHKNTIEFTKDKHLTMDGDCIVGVEADFDYGKLMNFIKNKEKIHVRLSVGEISDEFSFVVSHDFDDKHEIVIRRSYFNSKRTLGFRTTKAAIDIKRDLIDTLKNPESTLTVEFNEDIKQ
ncbi:DUF371 domain-containing protein [Candidatus Woesearchaeota archaeon]|nr:DUF371 domain-containing protein [Candidatus Woesearchaeota archaeon]